MISLEKICKKYDGKTILENLDLLIEKGEKIALMGRSGGGKTTLIRLISNLEKPDSGKLRVKGKISVVFQEDRLFNHLSVYQNVFAVCQSHEKTKHCLKSTLLWDDRDKMPQELSGGMARRVAISRAVAFDHDILILDEPFKGLDPNTRQTVMNFILENERDKTVILVTHDKEEADYFSAKQIFIS